MTDGQTLACVPISISVEADGSFQFVANVHTGEKFKVGYGNPTTIVHDAKEICILLCQKQPHSIGKTVKYQLYFANMFASGLVP